MSTRSSWNNGVLTFYDDKTGEVVAPLSSVVFYDDFASADTVVPAGGSPESGCKWCKKIVGGGPPTVAGVTSSANGVISCALEGTSEVQNAILYSNDNRHFDLTKGLTFECRAALSVLPTATTVKAVWGLGGAQANDVDAITYSLWFSCYSTTGLVKCEIDDNVTDQTVTSAISLVAGVYHIFRIDASDVTNIKFYIDGATVAGGTTFAYAATGANAVLQPYLGLYKTATTDTGTLLVDYVRIGQGR